MGFTPTQIIRISFLNGIIFSPICNLQINCKTQALVKIYIINHTYYELDFKMMHIFAYKYNLKKKYFVYAD